MINLVVSLIFSMRFRKRINSQVAERFAELSEGKWKNRRYVPKELDGSTYLETYPLSKFARSEAVYINEAASPNTSQISKPKDEEAVL